MRRVSFSMFPLICAQPDLDRLTSKTTISCSEMLGVRPATITSPERGGMDAHYLSNGQSGKQSGVDKGREGPRKETRRDSTPSRR